MEDFEFSLIVCFAVVLAVMVSGMGSSIGPLFSVALLALSQAGYFFVHQFRKAGLPVLEAEVVFIGAVFLCYFATLIAGGALSLLAPLIFVPVLFCTPAFALIVRHFIS